MPGTNKTKQTLSDDRRRIERAPPDDVGSFPLTPCKASGPRAGSLL